jgi:hypothetical protein
MNERMKRLHQKDYGYHPFVPSLHLFHPRKSETP